MPRSALVVRLAPLLVDRKFHRALRHLIHDDFLLKNLTCPCSSKLALLSHGGLILRTSFAHSVQDGWPIKLNVCVLNQLLVWKILFLALRRCMGTRWAQDCNHVDQEPLRRFVNRLHPVALRLNRAAVIVLHGVHVRQLTVLQILHVSDVPSSQTVLLSGSKADFHVVHHECVRVVLLLPRLESSSLRILS